MAKEGDEKETAATLQSSLEKEREKSMIREGEINILRKRQEEKDDRIFELLMQVKVAEAERDHSIKKEREENERKLRDMSAQVRKAESQLHFKSQELVSIERERSRLRKRLLPPNAAPCTSIRSSTALCA